MLPEPDPLLEPTARLPPAPLAGPELGLPLAGAACASRPPALAPPPLPALLPLLVGPAGWACPLGPLPPSCLGAPPLDFRPVRALPEGGLPLWLGAWALEEASPGSRLCLAAAALAGKAGCAADAVASELARSRRRGGFEVLGVGEAGAGGTCCCCCCCCEWACRTRPFEAAALGAAEGLADAAALPRPFPSGFDACPGPACTTCFWHSAQEKHVRCNPESMPRARARCGCTLTMALEAQAAPWASLEQEQVKVHVCDVKVVQGICMWT